MRKYADCVLRTRTNDLAERFSSIALELAIILAKSAAELPASSFMLVAAWLKVWLPGLPETEEATVRGWSFDRMERDGVGARRDVARARWRKRVVRVDDPRRIGIMVERKKL